MSDSRGTSVTASTQSTPTPPNKRGRRLRKCATPIKSAEKIEKHQRVVVRQGLSSLVLPSSTTSSTSEVTPSSSGTTTPAKVEHDGSSTSKSLATPLHPPLSSPGAIKKRKRIPYTLVEASKGNRCPTPGCSGCGHVTGLYAMHYAVSGCPIAAQKKKELEKKQGIDIRPPPMPPKRTPGRIRRKKRKKVYANSSNKKKAEGDEVPIVRETSKDPDFTVVTDSSATEAEIKDNRFPEELIAAMSNDGASSSKKRKRIPYTLVEASKGNKCPTPGCNGVGHITGLYSMHYAVSGCPIAHGKTPEECKYRRDELNKLREQASSVPAEAESSTTTTTLSSPPRKNLRLQATRNLSSTFEKVSSSPTSGAAAATPLRPPSQSLVNKSQSQSSNSTKIPEFRYPPVRPEPKLDGLVPTQDLISFREAQTKMREKLGYNSEKQEYSLREVEFGSHEIGTWYPSPYPPEYALLQKLYICEFCLRYFRSSDTLTRHKVTCLRLHPPGREIYRKHKISVFEVDGEDHKEYCQNLCLMAKLFLDHKTLYFDVEPFLFYVMTECDSQGCHMIGYFSKEKHSPQGYNVSCILTLPQHMRKGYGKMLIDFSYHLTRMEDKVGSPERPLSDLGLLSYRSYWKDAVLTYLVVHSSRVISIRELSQETGITCDDVISTLQYHGLLRYWKGKHIIIKRKEILEEHKRKLEERKSSSFIIDSSCIRWSPTSYPTYS